MKIVKKWLAVLLACVAAFMLPACIVEETPPADTTGGTTDNTGGSTDNTGGSTDNTGGEDTGVSFSVTLVYRYVDSTTNTSYDLSFTSALGLPDGLQAYWTGEDGVHAATFDSTGIAKCSGLDGDYQVTLSYLPDGFTYNPNIYSATNNNRDIIVTLYSLQQPVSGDGTGLYQSTGVYRLTSTGAYRATLSSADQVVFFEFRPSDAQTQQEGGTYTVQSLVDVTANEINPILDVYTGTFAWKPSTPTYTTDGGGAESSYTKNFKWEINLSSDMLGNVYTFGVRADSITDAKFPVDIDFIIERDGAYTGNSKNYPDAEISSVSYTVDEDGNYSLPEGYLSCGSYTGQNLSYEVAEDGGYQVYSGTGAYLGYVPAAGLVSDEYSFSYFAVNNGGIMDETLVQKNQEDGYYYMYNQKTGQYDLLLYAKLNQDSQVIVTDGGNGMLYELALSNLRCYSAAKGEYVNYYSFVLVYTLYETYLATFNGTSVTIGAAQGVVPVNEEIKLFLQDYAVGQRYFKDGDGYAEGVTAYGDILYNSDEQSQWLFNCGVFM